MANEPRAIRYNVAMTTPPRVTEKHLKAGKPTAEQLARLHEIQEWVRTFVPADVSLVDELIAERRAAAARGD